MPPRSSSQAWHTVIDGLSTNDVSFFVVVCFYGFVLLCCVCVCVFFFLFFGIGMASFHSRFFVIFKCP